MLYGIAYHINCIFLVSLSNTFSLEVVDYSFSLSLVMEKVCRHSAEQELIFAMLCKRADLPDIYTEEVVEHLQ